MKHWRKVNNILLIVFASLGILSHLFGVASYGDSAPEMMPTVLFASTLLFVSILIHSQIKLNQSFKSMTVKAVVSV